MVMHLGELISSLGMEEVKKLKMFPNKTEVRRWVPQARKIYNKLVNDQEFLRLCQLAKKTQPSLWRRIGIGSPTN